MQTNLVSLMWADKVLADLWLVNNHLFIADSPETWDTLHDRWVTSPRLLMHSYMAHKVPYSNIMSTKRSPLFYNYVSSSNSIIIIYKTPVYNIHCSMHVVCWRINRLLLLGDKQVALIGGQTGCPCWGTNRLSLLGDKQVALIGGQTGCPYWGTNRLPLLGDKQVALIGGQTWCPCCRTNRLPLLGNKQVALIGQQTGCPYCGTNQIKSKSNKKIK